MIKKGIPAKLTPGSNMEVVYRLIESGISSPHQLHIKSRMQYLTFRRALWNLTYTGLIVKHREGNLHRYTIANKQPRGGETESFARVSFIFHINTDEK